MSEPKGKTAAEATIDTVGGAISLLWDFLAPPKKVEIEKAAPPPSESIETKGESDDEEWWW